MFLENEVSHIADLLDSAKERLADIPAFARDGNHQLSFAALESVQELLGDMTSLTATLYMTIKNDRDNPSSEEVSDE